MPIYGSSRSLLTRFEVGQGSERLYARLEVGQDSAELLGKGDVQQSTSAELLGKADVTHSVKLLGKAEIQQSGSAELLGNIEVKNISSAELLGKAGITHSTELLCNAIIKNVGSAVLYARAEVGQDSRDLFAKFEAQDTQVLYAKGEIRQADLSDLHARAEVGQGSDELFAKAVVGQGSVELPGGVIVRNAASSDLKGTVDITHSIDLLGRTVIGHPALPAWLKAIFSIGLTNAYRDLGLSLELRRTVFVELFGKVSIRHPDSEEILGKMVIRQPGSADLLGKGIIKNVGSAELLCGFATQSFADLRAKMIIGPAKDSDTYFSFWDPSDWINEVVGVGQGFITIPWVEADAVIKTCGTSSARLTSVSNPNQYKEIRFGWGGMNWGFEAGVAPEVAPTPIDTGGRGPRRGSRAQRDQRREVASEDVNNLYAKFDLSMITSWLFRSSSPVSTQMSAESGYTETIVFNPLDKQVTLSAVYIYLVHSTNYESGTFIWDVEPEGVADMGAASEITLGGLTDSFFGESDSQLSGILLYYYGDDSTWYLLTANPDTTETRIDLSGAGVDFTARHTYKIIWENAALLPPNGRVRFYVDDVLKETVTDTSVPDYKLHFITGGFAGTIAANSRVGTKLYSYTPS